MVTDNAIEVVAKPSPAGEARTPPLRRCGVSPHHNRCFATTSIEIVLASNERYFVGLLVTAASMARHANVDALLSFNILDGGICEKSKDELCSTVKRLHNETRIQFLKLDLSLFDGLPTMSGSAMAYARLLLPRLLPQADYVLYCDVDFLWHADVAELWDFRDESCVVQSAPETSLDTLTKERKWAADSGVVFPDRDYFCSGLCLFNLRLIRERQADKMVFDFLSRHRDVLFFDQSALNFAWNGEVFPVGMLPRKWQMFSHDITAEEVCGDYVLHFAGNTPWAPVAVITDAELLWFRELAEIRGISIWQALRTIHGALHIMVGRLLFLVVATSAMARKLFTAMYKHTGQPDASWLFRRLSPACRSH